MLGTVSFVIRHPDTISDTDNKIHAFMIHDLGLIQIPEKFLISLLSVLAYTQLAEASVSINEVKFLANVTDRKVAFKEM